MRKLLALFLLLPMVASGATLHEAEYGVATTFNFLLYNTDGTLDVDEVDSGTEVAIACDEGAETTATNDFVDEGNFYSIALTAAEMACARATVVISATDTNAFFVETYGHPSAQNPCGDQPCLESGTAQASTASTIVLASATNITDDYLNGATVTIVDGTGAGQTRVCSDWVQSTDTCTVSENWDTTPSTDSDYLVYRTRFAALTVTNGGVDVYSIGGTTQTANDVGGDVNSILDDTGTSGVALTAAAADLVLDEVVEDQGSGYSLREAMSMILAEALGTCTYTSGTRTWVCSDPSGTETRFTLVYGSNLDGTRTSSTPAPVTP